MTSRPVRATLIILGVVLIFFGAVFGGQGLGYLPGSVMTGNITWFYIGTGMVVLGLVLLLLGLRRRRRLAR